MTTPQTGPDADARKLLALLKKVRSEADEPDSAVIFKSELNEAVNYTVNTLWVLEGLKTEARQAQIRDAAFKAALNLVPTTLRLHLVRERIISDSRMKLNPEVHGSLLRVTAEFDKENEWEIVFHHRTRKVTSAPDLFYVWYNNPDDLAHLGL